MLDAGERWREGDETQPSVTPASGSGANRPAQERDRADADRSDADGAALGRAGRGPIAREASEALGEAIAETAAHVDAATHRLLAQIREFDDSAGWYAQGAQSCAHWLSWRIGLSPGAAREKVRVARALGELPAIDSALARGEMSYCKVRAMTRVATPETEEALLEMARHATGAELEKICRLYRAARQSATGEGHGGGEDRRYVTAKPTDDGMVRITALVTAEESARIVTAIDAAAERVSAESHGRGQSLSRVDGLAHVAESYLRGDAPDRPPVEVVVTTPRAALSTAASASAETRCDTCHTKDQRRDEAGGDLDFEVCADDDTGKMKSPEATDPGRGKPTRDMPTLDDTPIPAETARRLSCDAGVVEIATDARGDPLDVGRKTRTISPALRRALKLRDGGCAYPGCSNHRFVDAHHVIHWSDGGETRKENLVLLCRSHHSLVHERGFRIEARDRGFFFFDPDGRPLPYADKRKPACVDTLLKAHADRGLHIDSETNMPMWSGRPPDYSAAIDALLSRALSST